MAIDCRAEINWVFCQPAPDDAQLLSGTDLVAPRSGGHVLDPHRSVVSDAGMEILFPCRDSMVIGSSVWPWQTALGSTLKPWSGEGAQICSCFENHHIHKQGRRHPRCYLINPEETLPLFSGEHSCVSWKIKGKSTPTRAGAGDTANTQGTPKFSYGWTFP